MFRAMRGHFTILSVSQSMYVDVMMTSEWWSGKHLGMVMA